MPSPGSHRLTETLAAPSAASASSAATSTIASSRRERPRARAITARLRSRPSSSAAGGGGLTDPGPGADPARRAACGHVSVGGMTTLPLTPDDLLATTRTVRRRLDIDRPVPSELVRECLELALQAPTGSNRQGWEWVV